MPQDIEQEDDYINPPAYDDPNGISLEKNNAEEPRFAPAQPSYDFVLPEPDETHNESPQFTTKSEPQLAATQLGRLTTAEIFHYVSLLSAILSLAVSPLIELVPMILWFCVKKELYAQDQRHVFLHKIDFIVTLIVAFIFLLLIIFLTIISLGIYIVFIVLLVPFLFVLIQLFVSWPKVPLAQPTQSQADSTVEATV